MEEILRTILILIPFLALAACGDGDDDTAADSYGDGGQALADDGGTTSDGGDTTSDGGGTTSDGGDDFVEEIDCEILDLVTCKKDPACRVLSAFAVVPAVGGGYCVDNEERVDVGCTAAEAQCTYVTSWGAEPSASDQCYIFGDCQPEGWGHCAEAVMRTTNPC